MMNEPTKAQLERFWKWCGLTLSQDKDGTFVWHDAEGDFVDFGYPEIDLNNLFKFAVPRILPEHDFALYYVLDDRSAKEGNWAVSMSCPGYEEYGIIRVRAKDPALALFWALDKMREEASK